MLLVSDRNYFTFVISGFNIGIRYIYTFLFSEMSLNGKCKTGDSHQCADQQAECKNDKCLCKDKHYLKDNHCEPRM